MAIAPDLSLRGATRRSNLAVPDQITGKPSAKTQLPSRDCTPRALPRASRSGRHVGLWPPRNDNSGSFAILTAACTRRKCGAGSGMPLPYNGVCGRRECTEICRCATRRRGRRPLQRTAGSLGKFSAFRLPRAFLSCQIQKSDRLIWVSRSGFSDYGASSSPPVDSVGASVGGSVGSGSVGFSVGLSVGLSVGSVGASVGGSVSSTSLATRRLRQS